MDIPRIVLLDYLEVILNGVHDQLRDCAMDPVATL